MFNSGESALLCFTTCALPDEAQRLAHTLVSESLAACVNIVPAIRSVYRWEGRVHDESEILLLIKTTRAVFPKLQARIESLHSYDVPEILSIPVAGGSPRYLDWLVAQVQPEL